ncbi:unnamed protein product, partial [Rotaria sordida]
MVKTYSQKH